MSATFEIISHRVGEGGIKHGLQVQRIQQLLRLNGYRISHINGKWTSETSDALVMFQKALSDMNTDMFMCDSRLPALCKEPRPYVVPHDSFLFELAYGAGVLIPLCPFGRIFRGPGGIYGGRGAFERVHEWCQDKRNKVGFDLSPERAVWGLKNYMMWGIVTFANAFHLKQPRALNCTLYANLMLSVWRQGNAHAAPFSARVADTGGANHLAGRYGYPLKGTYTGPDDVKSVVHLSPARLYCLEPGSSGVGHEALLVGGRIYESNFGGCSSYPLEAWLGSSWHSKGWISGPSPN
jgi:hypothetical protein